MMGREEEKRKKKKKKEDTNPDPNPHDRLLTDQKKARSDVVEKREISTIMYTCYLTHIETLD